MKQSISSRAVVVGAAILALTGAISLQAQLISWEPFDYPADSQLFGQTHGSGWATAWSATTAAVATNNATGLFYGSVPAEGGSVVMGNPTGTTGPTASSQRLLPGTLGTLASMGSGTIWMSFLYQNWVTEIGVNPSTGNPYLGYREAKIALFSGATANANGTANVNGSERLDVGSPNTYAAGASDTLSLWQGSTYMSSGIATPRGANPANTVFVLLRLNVDNTTAADTAYAWFNPSLASEPSTATAIAFSTADLSGVNAIRLQAGNLNTSALNAVFQADDIRVGLDFASMTMIPEPTAAALGVVGGLILLALRPRKK
jgi:hypothetical protein